MKYSEVRENCSQGEWTRYAHHPSTKLHVITYAPKERREVAEIEFAKNPLSEEAAKKELANASLICHEHNMFPKLLEALRKLECECVSFQQDNELTDILDSYIAEARIVIEEASEVKGI